MWVNRLLILLLVNWILFMLQFNTRFKLSVYVRKDL